MSDPAADAQHLLIPFASAPGAACRAALPGLRLPNLQALLGRLRVADEDRQDAATLSPPHERARARALGLVWGRDAGDGLLPWAAWQARALGLPGAHADGWGWVTLCHWQVGMSEVVMDDPEALDLDAAESETLLRAMRPFFDEDGLALFPTPRPGRWLARGAALAGLPTAAIDRAAGQPLAPWLPMHDAARPLRRLQNEMQMLLYTHPLHDARTARGVRPINAFWFSGTGAAPSALPAAAAEPHVALDLRDNALRDDGAAWAARWQALDTQALAPLLAQARAGRPVVLTLCGERAALRLDSGPRGLGNWLRSRLNPPQVATVLEAL